MKGGIAFASIVSLLPLGPGNNHEVRVKMIANQTTLDSIESAPRSRHPESSIGGICATTVGFKRNPSRHLEAQLQVPFPT